MSSLQHRQWTHHHPEWALWGYPWSGRAVLQSLTLLRPNCILSSTDFSQRKEIIGQEVCSAALTWRPWNSPVNHIVISLMAAVVISPANMMSENSFPLDPPRGVVIEIIVACEGLVVRDGAGWGDGGLPLSIHVRVTQSLLIKRWIPAHRE